MSDVLKEMLVSFGFSVDKASQSQAEAAIKANEERITKQNIAQAAKRLEADKQANVARVAAAAAAGEAISEEEKKLVLEQAKRNREAAERQAKLEAEEAKKGRERREASFKQLSDFTLRAAALATKVVAGIEAVAGGILFTADKAAAGLERLNYAAQSSGSSVKGMNAFAYAIAQNGGSADAAQASLKRFGDQLQKFPAYEQLLKSMGVATRDMNGEMRKTEDIATDFMGHLGKQNRVTREALGEKLGFDEGTVQAGTRPGLRENEAQYNRDQAALGNDPNSNATKGTGFAQSARHLREQIGGMGERVEGNMFEQLKPQLDDLSKWIDAHGDHVAEILSRIASDIIKLARAVLRNLAKVDWDSVLTKVENFAKDFEKTATKYFGENGTLALPFIAFGAMLTGKVLGPINAIVAGLGVLGKIPGLAALLGNPAVLGTAAVGAVLASGDPNKALVDGGKPDLGPRDNDLGLPGLEHEDLPENSTPSRPSIKGLWSRLKDMLGLGGAELDDHRVKDAILATAESTRKLAEAADHGSGGEDGGGALGRARRTLGFVATASGDHTHVSGSGKVGDLSKNPYATKENADAIKAAAKELGTTPEDLATVIGYETGGTFSPSKIGGAGNRYQGLIQFGPNERAQYGANGGQTFVEQMEAVKRYLKGRGFKPGMGLLDLYSTINAGSPGHYGASDGNGTVASHVTRMQGATAALARAFLAKGDAPAATASAPSPAGTSGKAVSDAEVMAARQRIINGSRDPKDHAIVDQYLKDKNTSAAPAPSATLSAAHRVLRWAGKGSNVADPADAPITTVDRRDPRFAPGAPPIKVEVTKAVPLTAASAEVAQHLRNLNLERAASHGMLHPYLHGKALGDTEAMRRAVHHSITKGDTNLNHSQVFNIQGGDVKQNMEAARLTANRGQQDILRNIQVLES